MVRKILCIVILSFMLVCVFSSCDIINKITHTHDFDEWETTKTATCTESGSKERYCECGEKQTQTIYATGHQYDEWFITKEPTCTEIGNKERYCECGEKQTQNISATGHKYGEWVVAKEAACIVDGLKEKTCVACQCKETETISAQGNHNYVDGVCSGCSKEAETIVIASKNSTIILPDVPKKLYNGLIGVIITSIEWSMDQTYVYITLGGEKTVDYYGDYAGTHIHLTYKILDSEGYVDYSDEIYIFDLNVGEKFRDKVIKIPISSLNSNTDYVLRITF